MRKRPLRRVTLLTGVAVILIAIGCSQWLHARQHQYHLNRQLIAALVAGDNPKALALVDAGADPDTPYNPPPPPTLKQCWTLLLRHSAPPTDNSPTAFLIACGVFRSDDGSSKTATQASLETVRAMIRNGADLSAKDADGETALHGAAHFPKPDIADLLLQHGFPVDARDNLGNTPLLTATSSLSSVDLVHLLLDHGADVNTQNKDGNSPLIAASTLLEIGTVRLLLERGADVNIRNTRRRTPLICAAGRREDSYGRPQPNLVPLLLQHGADVNASDEDGETALITAAATDARIVDVLLKNGANVNARDTYGQTPLLSTGDFDFEGRISVVAHLLAHGADPNLPDTNGMTILKRARHNRWPDVVALLQRAGAKK